jgi:hypothetical protein
MVQVQRAAWEGQMAGFADAASPVEERWPLGRAAAFACSLSIALWSVIIAAVAWVV